MCILKLLNDGLSRFKQGDVTLEATDHIEWSHGLEIDSNDLCLLPYSSCCNSNKDVGWNLRHGFWGGTPVMALLIPAKKWNIVTI